MINVLSALYFSIELNLLLIRETKTGVFVENNGVTWSGSSFIGTYIASYTDIM